MALTAFCVNCCHHNMFHFAGRVLCHLEPCGDVEVNQAVKAAKSAFGHWSKMSGMERARIMIETAHIIEVEVLLLFICMLLLRICKLTKRPHKNIPVFEYFDHRVWFP